jgi:hypothetical protein
MQETNLISKLTAPIDPDLMMALDFEGTNQIVVDSAKPSRLFSTRGNVANVDLNTTTSINGTRCLRQGQPFSGISAFIITAVTSDLTFPGDFWFETWGYCQGQGDVTFTGNFNPMLSFGSFGVAGGMSRWALINLKQALTIPNGTSESVLFTSSLSVVNNAWHHQALGRQGSTLYSFTDGVLGGTINYTGTVGFGAELSIAGYNDSRISGQTYAGFNGYLDRMRMYRKCLFTSAFTPSTKLFGQK